MELPDGRRLAYAEYGDPRGRALLYFHGWPSSRLQGRALDEVAAERGLRVISPDRPGIGMSDPLPGRRFGDWPADVAALADSLGLGRFFLLGVSGGGPYILATAAKLGERVKAAAVVGGAPPLGEPADRHGLHWAYRMLASLERTRRTVVPAVIGAGRWMVERGSDKPPMSWILRSIPPVDREALRGSGGWELVSRGFLEAARGTRDGVLEEGELYLQPWDFAPERIRVPVRIWHGMADQNLPWELARRLAARIPGAATRWIEGGGHYSLPLERRGEIVDDLLAAGPDGDGGVRALAHRGPPRWRWKNRARRARP